MSDVAERERLVWQLRIWGRKALLAGLDEKIEDVHALAEEISNVTLGGQKPAVRWLAVVDDLLAWQSDFAMAALHGGLILENVPVALAYRETAEELTPWELLPAVGDRIAEFRQHQAQIEQDYATTDNPTVRPHPWRSQVGNASTFYAALAATVWVARQPQTSNNQPAAIREQVLRGIREASAHMTGAPARETVLEVADAEAIQLLLDIFGGEDIFEIPAAEKDRSTRHAELLAVARRWLLEHDSARPTAEQASALRLETQRVAFGVVPAPEGPLDWHHAVPADARPLTAADQDAVVVLALRLLEGFLLSAGPQVRQAMADLATYGPLGYRCATHAVSTQALSWSSHLKTMTTVRSDKVIPHMEQIIKRVIPANQQTTVWTAYFPTLLAFTEAGATVLEPGLSENFETDLYLMTAYASWFALQPQINPPAIREQLTGVMTYLSTPDRTTTIETLSTKETENARLVLEEMLGKHLVAALAESATASESPESPAAAVVDQLLEAQQSGRSATMRQMLATFRESTKRTQGSNDTPQFLDLLLLAAHDHHHGDQHARHQIQRMWEFHEAYLTVKAPRSRRGSTPAEKAARQAAQRRLAQRRRGKSGKGKR
ncbi:MULTISPECIES: hypothetical protein [unclassified Crossiella]|uniref:hypothetical protein n=1 Tax=unclassified Crossiella TaxID=2620835 RepID=UPI001FFFE0BB|nr:MULTISPECIES: hypothetical protein [unclassified Crossiella]MCK2245434.1 hypothetical protein [Crossiella sp. S99.2]MCK2259086.1 hypothetical protein [Crossiella sp. S99.1]